MMLQLVFGLVLLSAIDGLYGKRCESPNVKFSGKAKTDKSSWLYNFTIDFQAQTIVFKDRKKDNSNFYQVNYVTRKIHQLTHNGKCTTTKMDCKERALPQQLIPPDSTTHGIGSVIYKGKKYYSTFYDSKRYMLQFEPKNSDEYIQGNEGIGARSDLLRLLDRSFAQEFVHDPKMAHMIFDTSKCKEA